MVDNKNVVIVNEYKSHAIISEAILSQDEEEKGTEISAFSF